MKRVIFLALALVIAFCLVGCNMSGKPRYHFNDKTYTDNIDGTRARNGLVDYSRNNQDRAARNNTNLPVGSIPYASNVVIPSWPGLQ